MRNCLYWIALLTIALCSRSLAEEKIAWYGDLRDGLNAARATGKPIMLISAAVQCKGVSGIY